MTKYNKLVLRILSGKADKNISFSELINLLTRLEFEERIKGSHHIFFRNGIDEIINLQPGKGGMAKPYQVKQVRNILTKYKLVNYE